MVALPLVLPPSVLGFYLLLLMGPQGPVGQLTQTLGLGRLPGDLHFKLFGREWYIPLASTVVLSVLASLIGKLI